MDGWFRLVWVGGITGFRSHGPNGTIQDAMFIEFSPCVRHYREIQA